MGRDGKGLEQPSKQPEKDPETTLLSGTYITRSIYISTNRGVWFRGYGMIPSMFRDMLCACGTYNSWFEATYAMDAKDPTVETQQVQEVRKE